MSDQLRDAWRVLADQIRWQDVAEFYISRGRFISSAPDAVLEAARFFRGAAAEAFEAALAEPSRAWLTARILVVLQPDNPDRPIELFAEALNAAAYHAKVEEIWPLPTKAIRASEECSRCHSMAMSLTAGEKICGDCLSLARWPNKPKAQGLPPAPGVHLSPGALYHLQDDPDSTGIPGGHH